MPEWPEFKGMEKRQRAGCRRRQQLELQRHAPKTAIRKQARGAGHGVRGAGLRGLSPEPPKTANLANNTLGLDFWPLERRK